MISFYRIFMKERTLITGASSGIGLALAHEFARNGHPLVITAPIDLELQGIAQDLRQNHAVDVQVFAADLERDGSCEEIFDFAQGSGGIDILVNDAGLGQRGNFWETSIERDISIIRVNIEAVVRLTKLFLPHMVAKNRGRILNLASIAGFEPGPLLAVYHGSKAFVLSFTEALGVELDKTEVTVTALCPGPTDTDFFTKADMEQTRVFQEGSVMAPREVAEKGYAALMRGDRVYVPGVLNKTLVFSRRFMTESGQARINERFYEEVDEHKRERGDIEHEARHN
jgi:short-subunit dehydrogenase